MKHAGSVRARVVLCVALWGMVAQALTPPRIIYGGWTPILPGHPFYFGPVRQRNAEPSKEYYPGTPYKTQEAPHPNDAAPEKENHYRSPNGPKGRSPPYQKDIYAYYPPQSAFEGPKHPRGHHKRPVYLEDAPGKYSGYRQQQLLEGAGKPPTAYRQILLNQDVDTGEKTFIRITPLGSVDANDLEHLGQIDLSDIQLVSPNVLRKYPIDVVPDYPVVKNPAVGLYPTVKDYSGIERPYSFEPYNGVIGQSPLHYKVIGASPAYKTPANIYESGLSSLSGHGPIARPLNPIETKKLRNILRQADKQIADLSPAHKAPPSLYGVGKKPLSPAAKSFAKQMRAYLGSRPHYGHRALSAIAPYRPLPQNLAYLPLKTTSPKFSTLGYSDPAPKTSASPLDVVGKHQESLLSGSRYTDGALQALKALSQGGSYADVGLQTLKTSSPGNNYADIGLQTLKTSSPGNSYADIGLNALKTSLPGNSYADIGLQTLKTSSPGSSYADIGLQTLKTSSPGNSYADIGLQALKTSSPGSSYSDIGLQTLKTSSPSGSSYADIGLREVKASPDYGLRQALYKASPEEYLYLTASTPQSTQVSDGDGANKGREEYIFVSSSGARGTEGGGEKQFFHAYYAPADHSPPPGYVRMAVQEFRELFRNADIRYVDGKEP